MTQVRASRSCHFSLRSSSRLGKLGTTSGLSHRSPFAPRCLPLSAEILTTNCAQMSLIRVAPAHWPMLQIAERRFQAETGPTLGGALVRSVTSRSAVNTVHTAHLPARSIYDLRHAWAWRRRIPQPMCVLAAARAQFGLEFMGDHTAWGDETKLHVIDRRWSEALSIAARTCGVCAQDT